MFCEFLKANYRMHLCVFVPLWSDRIKKATPFDAAFVISILILTSSQFFQ